MTSQASATDNQVLDKPEQTPNNVATSPSGNKTKYIVGFSGLAIGFIIAFFMTQSFNRNNATVPVGKSTAASPGGEGSGGDNSVQGQQAMMSQVAEIVDKAKHNPNDFEAQVAAARVFAQVNRNQEMLEYLKKAFEIDKKQAVEMGIGSYLGGTYLLKGDYREAESYIKRSLEVQPEDPNMLALLGATYLKREPPDPDKGLQSIGFALKLAPDNPTALAYSVQANLLKKNARGAEDSLTALKKADSASPDIPKYESLIADLKAGRPVKLTGLSD